MPERVPPHPPMPSVAPPPYVLPSTLDAIIARGLEEDVGSGDVTSRATVPASTSAEATFLAKEPGVIAGLEVAARVFSAVDASLEVVWHRGDGDAVDAGTEFGAVLGPARGILTAERLALNVLQRMSGIATATRRMVEAAAPRGVRILDTRKTAPGLRVLDKWAVLLGGGANHRLGLYDMILIKDNHIAAVGGIRAAIEAALRHRDTAGRPLPIEIEARTLDEVREVLAAGGVDVVLLDNMVRVAPDGTVDTSVLRDAVGLIDGRFETEASGNVSLETVPAIAATGVTSISSGALTHSVQALDVSLKITLGA